MRPKSVVNLTTCPSPSSVLERILMQHEGACCYTQTRLMGLPARTAEKRLGVGGPLIGIYGSFMERLGIVTCIRPALVLRSNQLDDAMSCTLDLREK